MMISPEKHNMSQINIQYYKTKVGEVILASFDGKLCMLDWKYRKMRTTVDNRIRNGLKAEFVESSDDVIDNAIAQLDEYLSGDRNKFDIPLLMVGTEFQKSVWNALIEVPYGVTSTYLQLAEKLSNKKAVRAVASANGANAISIIVPCHRIIGSDGALVVYAGGLPVKKYLLEMEQGTANDTDNQQYHLDLGLEQGI